ncbi:GntR family transcriptional regulator [Agromyces aerolatus]|uniref:GntR family transcriptional regulator n=1 Tax=Agromyces sp. LY-1074 TaxID=3074080 RepID=UPI00285DD0A8|nr:MULTISPECIES: GntR family transcriptional regulator [unclassified Agromyces]MDR5701628.1 GntR family transcriptional regulator [Agromyces sp. LY-1074]MDR5707932.1 GntR family transcriptional regulator [Agromyces sp. LY-1358]
MAQTTPLIRMTVVDRVVEVLRDEVLSGRLPLGEPLREEQVADRVGASRHTVRTAFHRLAAERVLVALPYRGVRVAELEPGAIVELQQLRAALEGEAVRIANERFGSTWPADVTAPAEAALARLAELGAAGSEDWLAVERAHADFHRALVGASGSSRIVQAHAALESELMLFLLHMRPHYGLGDLVDEHRSFLADVQHRGSVAVHEHLAHSTRLLLGD